MSETLQITEKTKQTLLKKLPTSVKALKMAKQNLITATIMPIIFALLTVVGLSLVMIDSIKSNNLLIVVIYSIPIILVFLLSFVKERKKYLKILNEIIGKCSDNQLTYRQYCAYLKENQEFKSEIDKIFAESEKVNLKTKTLYNIVLEQAPLDNKLDIIQALTGLGCSIEVAKHASQTPNVLVFSKLTEEQALKNAETLESFGAKTKIESVVIEDVDEEYVKTVDKIRKNHRVLELFASVSVIVMLILFALPIININAIIAKYDCGIFSFIFADGNSSDGILALLMADFIGVKVQTYNDIFTLISSFNLSNILYFVSVVSLLLVTLVYGFVLITEVIGLIMALFNSEKKAKSNVAVCDSYKEKLANLTKEQLANKKIITVKLFSKYLVGKLIRIFLTIYFPVSLMLHITKDSLITISPFVTILLVVAIVTNLVASCLKWLYAAKYPVELENVDYLRKTVK